ncbi:unnamed protein product, partial [Mesorhabditis belari]|uniref:Uncharacterized protein n=1 Tax=Mesorhabditis belari TaxID=2138241 RepID=A0AAF3FQ73_9BILA
MGHYSLLAFVALIGSVSADILCNSGSATTDRQGNILTSHIKAKSCQGVCNTVTASLLDGEELHIFGCEEKYKTRKTILSGVLCGEDLCNTLPGLGLPTFDEIIEPLQNFTFTCYVGLKHGMFTVGGIQQCDGACGTLQTTANGLDSEAFFCAPRGLCAAFLKNATDPYEACITVGGNLTACCCEERSNCNALDFHVTDIPPLPTDNRVPIACYSGIHLSGALITGGEYVACQGNCASLKWQLNSDLDLTLYSCDPATICRGYGLNNKCAGVDNNTYYGCCCDTDACIDPTRVPPVSPDNPASDWIECYIGVNIKNTTTNAVFNAGTQNYCNGMCASGSTMLNGYAVEAFYCAQRSFCQALDTVNRCDTTSIGDQILSSCCCDDSANCNIRNRDIPTVAPDATVQPTQMIACFQGLYINNQSMSGGFVACDGDCASITLPTTVGGERHDVTLFTCDPADLCRQLGLINNCQNIDGVISGCCCDSDVCINPYNNRYPNGNNSLSCFVGVTVGTDYMVGGSMPCDGECGSLETTVNGVHAAGYFCASRSLCKTLGVHNDCASVLSSLYVKGCCCDWDNNCNAIADNVTVPTYVPQNRPPLACYNGLSLNNQLLQDGNQYMACRGDCGSITFSATVAGNDYNATMFTCDPVNICGAFNLKDSCGSIRQGDKGGVSGCCCSWNDCIDINNPRVKPSRDNLQCYVGFTLEDTNNNNKSTTYGDSMPCDGNCASIQTIFNGVMGWSYFCASTKLCGGLNMTNDCTTIFTDSGSSITGCCCGDDNNCNINNAQVGTPVPPATGAPDNRSPIACYSGLGINNIVLTDANSYTTCQGNCASATFSTSLQGKVFNTTIYSCDPVSLCATLGTTGKCSTIQNDGTSTTLSGCCCDWDDCIDTLNNGQIKPFPNNSTHKPDDLTCLVGYSISQFVGAAMPCTGSCVSVQTTANGADLFGYFCAPDYLCDTLKMHDQCVALLTTPFVEGCCCDDSSNCNNKNNYPLQPYVPPARTPIACYSGIAVNGKLLSDRNSFITCRGQCGSITLTTQLQGNAVNATLFACDPVTVCDSFNVNNGCGGTPNGLVSGCCCEWNDCIDIDKNQVKPSRDDMQCFVGFALEGSKNGTYGSTGSCDGQCASVQTTVNSVNTWFFFCATNRVCDGLNMTNDCDTLFNSNGEFIKACCCSDSNNCNINNAHVKPAPTLAPAPTTLSPIACYVGVNLMGKLVTAPDSYQTCFGECASFTYASTFNDQTVRATIFSCDPVALCSQFGLDGTCATIQADSSSTVISGCCCGSDDCLDTSTGLIKPQVSTSKQCFVGLSVTGPAYNGTYGEPGRCDGQCGSIETSVNGHNTYGFFCASNNLCNSLNLHNQCLKIYGDSTPITGCCCNDVDNCNFNNQPVPPAPTGVPTPAPGTSPIACYSGVSISANGSPAKLLTPSDSYMTCVGSCASVSYSTSFMNTSYTTTVFSCDPVAICAIFGQAGDGCGTLIPDDSTTIGGCCCSWDDCIDTSNGLIKPVPKLASQCFVGLAATGPSYNGSYGELGKCDGQCGTIITSVNGHNTYGFFCASNNLCNALSLHNGCLSINNDANQPIAGCCCNDVDGCNFNNQPVPPAPTGLPTQSPNTVPIACYSGLSLSANGNTPKLLTPSDSYQSCFGSCAAVSYTTSLMNNSVTATVFSCDPVAICSVFGQVGDGCGKLYPDNSTTIGGCCCSWDDCIDKTNGMIKPPPTPQGNNQCFVGFSLAGPVSNVTYGQSVTGCDGQCGTMSSSVNGHNAYAFFCASNTLCGTLSLVNTCRNIKNDANQPITGCCCNNGDNCNINNQQVLPGPTGVPTTAPGTTPIACFSGMSLGIGNTSALVTPDNSYQACFGSCSSLSLMTVFSNYSVSATVFSCDPVSVCNVFQDNGKSCGTFDADNVTSVAGCCCNWDDCIDKTNGMIKPPPTPQGNNQCFVGFSLVGPVSNVTYGQSVTGCDGQCGTMSSSVNGHNAYAFFCASNTLCGSLSLVNTCRNIKNDANQPITGCCCNSGDNCNIKNQQVLPGPTGVPTTAPGTPPIACFSGMSLGIGNTSALVTPDNSYQACFGSCSSLSLMTVFSNYSVSATVFSCDPVSVCNVFQDNGKSCGTFDADNVTSVAGCCCGWNDCIDKTNGQIRTTTAPPESATKSSSYPSFLIVLALSLTKILLA